MATIGNTVLTLMDWAKRLDPGGKTADIVEILSQANDVLRDMRFAEGNLPTGHRTTVRTGLPTVAWRLLNQGVTPSKSTTAQIDEACGILEAWSEVDIALADLNGNTAEFRLSEASAFVEAMNQEFARVLFYGNASVDPEQFTGLSTRYSSLSATNGSNILNAAGAGSDNSSVWLIGWGAPSVHGIFPKGSMAGLDHKDWGEQVVETSAAMGGTRLAAFRDQWVWKGGIALRDWRYCVRIANVDISNLVGKSSAADLADLMIKAIHRLPATQGSIYPAFYMNRSCFEMLDIQRRDDVVLGGQLTYDVVDGRPNMAFRGIPIGKVDQLVETETVVS